LTIVNENKYEYYKTLTTKCQLDAHERKDRNPNCSKHEEQTPLLDNFRKPKIERDKKYYTLPPDQMTKHFRVPL
jgi:hypothetical protein